MLRQEIAEIQTSSFYQIAVVGDQKVGKTSLLQRFLLQGFGQKESQSNKKWIQLRQQIIQIQNKPVRIEFVDIISRLINKYASKANAFLIIFDINDLNSFDKIWNYVQQIRQVDEKKVIVLVGNKTDEFQKKGEVKYENAYELATVLNCLYFEVSAKNDLNVQEMFKSVIQLIAERNEENSLI